MKVTLPKKWWRAWALFVYDTNFRNLINECIALYASDDSPVSIILEAPQFQDLKRVAGSGSSHVDWSQCAEPVR